MKQTAVQWLIEQMKKPYSDKYIMDILDQAIEMERQQIIDFAEKYDEYCHQSYISNRHAQIKSAEHYYTQTFTEPKND